MTVPRQQLPAKYRRMAYPAGSGRASPGTRAFHNAKDREMAASRGHRHRRMGRGRSGQPRQHPVPLLARTPCPQSWFARFMGGPGIKEAPLLPEIAIASSHLPEPLHGDPADRFIIATARHHQIPIVTRDGKIIDYAVLGHVNVIAC